MLLLLSAAFLSKLTFTKNSFVNPIRVLNSLEPDQDQRYIGPDLVPNCMQRLSAGVKYRTGKERFKILVLFASMSA